MKLKTAIVTGGSRGIGRGIALRLARDGMQVVICARSKDGLAEVEREIELFNGSVSSLALDLRMADAPSRLAEFAVNRYGGIDLVVNNAGATRRGAFTELGDDDWTDGFALKFFGAVRLTRAAWPHLKAASGSVVFISGVGGRTPGADFGIGGSVNAALLSFTKAMADAGIRDGVQVNAINPGAIRTARLKLRLAEIAAKQGVDIAAAEQEMIRAANITRIGEPEDIASLVAFIASPEGRFLQGALIDLDGGATKTI